MKIVSWNVNGIRACAKKGFLTYLRDCNPDLLCLQETKAHPDQVELPVKEPEGRVGHWSAAERKGYSGTATFYRKSDSQFEPRHVEHGIGIKKFDQEGRFVITDHKDFLLYNVYFPNGSASEERHLFKQDFLKRFTKHLKDQMAQGREVIVLGDYNVAYMEIDVFDPVRLSRVSGFLPEERNWFSSFLQAGFTDSFRHFYPHEPEKYTWWSYRENARLGNRGWRIDHICVSPGLVDRLKSVEIHDRQMGSDHCPIVLELRR